MIQPNPEADTAPDRPFHDWRSRPAIIGTRRDPRLAPGVQGPEQNVLVVPINPVKKRGKKGGTITHREFYPVALSLDIAMKASVLAEAAFNAIEFHVRESTAGPEREVKLESHHALLDYLEQCMVAQTFSAQAIETFANEVIGDVLAGGKFSNVNTRSGLKRFTGAAIQRNCSTEEKVGDVLPRLLPVAPIDKSGRLWNDFKTLLDLRDDIIHLKSESQRHDRQYGVILDSSTLWHRLLNLDIREQPRTAALVLHHFGQAVEPEPTWVPHIVDKFGIADARPRPVKTPGTITTITVEKLRRKS
jgi:hypothetical protein